MNVTESAMAKKQAKPLPTLLTAADAMLHAADKLESQVGDMELVALVVKSFSGRADQIPPGMHVEEVRAKMDELRTLASGIVDLDLQKAAMRSAAQQIRALANETKLAEARAAARGVRPQ